MGENIQIIGLKELEAAVKRNPKVVLSEAKNFINRGLSRYESGIMNNPWRIGSSGGGSPVKTGHLRQSHQKEFGVLQGAIGPDMSLAPYAFYVHEGTRRMKPRPWLDHVKNAKKGEIEKLMNEFLEKIVKDLAK